MLADPNIHANVGCKSGGDEPNKLTTYEMAKQLFEVDESGERPNWPFTFSIDFVERRFDLAARTRREMQEWVRALNLIVTLNKIGFSVAEKNPYTFEAQQKEMSEAG